MRLYVLLHSARGMLEAALTHWRALCAIICETSAKLCSLCSGGEAIACTVSANRSSRHSFTDFQELTVFTPVKWFGTVMP